MQVRSAKSTFQKINIVVKILLVLVILCISNNLYSQRQHLQGRVATSDDLEVEGINIFNVSTSKGTVTNEGGNFQIDVGLKDTLSISALHIQDTKLVIGEEQLKTQKIIINLSEKMNELSTVTLRRPLTGYLANDANIIPTQNPITATSLRLPNADLPKLSKTSRLLYAANSGPVDMLVNALSGRTKMLKKRLEFEKTAALTLALLEKFPKTYFTDALKIDTLEVYSFIFFCEADPDYQRVMKQDSMEIIEFLEKKSVEFRK